MLDVEHVHLFPSMRIVFKLAENIKEFEEYFCIRREIFVKKQKIFKDTDIDEYDEKGIHIIAKDIDSNRVVGGVRCYNRGNGVWFGGRLAVLNNMKIINIGSKLVKEAMREVKIRGCKRFLAYVQPKNIRYFKRLGWNEVNGILLYLGRPHQLMEADLNKC